MSRLFFAVRTPEPLRRKLLQIQRVGEEVFRDFAYFPNCRKENLENSHLTLLFVGEVPDTVISPLIESVNALLSNQRYSPFSMRLDHIGFFPNTRNARTIWIGAEPQQEFERLHQLVTSISKQTASDLFKNIKTEKFTPHLTLFRLRESYHFREEQLQELHDSIHEILGEEELSDQITEFELVQSFLSPQGAKHRAIAHFPLQ